MMCAFTGCLHDTQIQQGHALFFMCSACGHITASEAEAHQMDGVPWYVFTLALPLVCAVAGAAFWQVLRMGLLHG